MLKKAGFNSFNDVVYYGLNVNMLSQKAYFGQ